MDVLENTGLDAVLEIVGCIDTVICKEDQSVFKNML